VYVIGGVRRRRRRRKQREVEVEWSSNEGRPLWLKGYVCFFPPPLRPLAFRLDE